MMPIVNSLEEARQFFIKAHTGPCLCHRGDGKEKEIGSYPEAEEFYNGS